MSLNTDRKWKKAIQALVNKLELVHENPYYKSVWFDAYLHQGAYNGPNYEDELKAVKRLLDEKDG